MTTAQSGSGDIQRSLELLWGLKEAPTRGPKRGLTLREIVRAAVEAADADGIEALSMRRVATDLGVGTMSLYRYVPGKAELLELMLDHTYGAPSELDRQPHRDWRTEMEALARGSWKMYLEHHWLLQINVARPLLGPNALAGFDFAMAALVGLGLSDQERVSVIVAIDNFVSGSARTQINSLEAAKRTGVSDTDFWAAQEPILTTVMQSGAYPALAELAEDSFALTGEDFFEFGLVRLLDGLADFVEAASAREDRDDRDGRARSS
ncbi:TetR/AcrR family transcriptional regulator [Streptomyces sp. N2-109]|uniref:TetR/AcrR family transcriptional regulator n=1 Tax=Streptomyces gossypii TaxID=2883101 RepID=A0ABT2JXR7_9ACTN|nr:TetR/AcrR family transcriptional regulator [Streptomyces gossypii]MCT2592697.1 TetR/AcrR family transcriptional regulator [Streptomyces gossypii]